MSDLSSLEKRKFKRLFGMSKGYVLDFSNRTFAKLVEEHTGRYIYDAHLATMAATFSLSRPLDNETSPKKNH